VEPTINKVVHLETVGDRFGCHLRIWKDSEGTIMLAGQLDDLYLPMSRIEECVEELAWRFLRDGRAFDFFAYRPGEMHVRVDPDAPPPSSLEDFRQLPMVQVEAPFIEVVFEVDAEQRATNALLARIAALSGTGRLHANSRGVPWAFRNPTWHYWTREEFEERIGGPVDVFPHDPKELYQSRHVQAYIANGCQPTVVSWDPYGLLDDLAAVRALDEAIRSERARSEQANARTQRRDAEQRIRLFRVAAHHLASDTRGYQFTYERESPEDPPSALLRRQYPVLDETDWELLDHYRKDAEPRDQRVGKGEGSGEAVLALRALLDSPTLASELAPEAIQALRRAEGRITWWAHITDPYGFRADDHPPTMPSQILDVLGEPDHAYLATVDWRQPREGDEPRLGRLADKVHSYFLDRTRHPPEELSGYDPFGRLVLRLPDDSAYLRHRGDSAFLVEWPLKLPAEPYPDDALIVGCDSPDRAESTGARPVYIRLPDGRMDLLPIDPSHSYSVPPFKWGYSGGGPGRLEAAIMRACCEDYRKTRNSKPHHQFQHWLDAQVEDSASTQRLELKVGQIRRRFFEDSGQ
jgi:hypothetical protein